MIEQGINLELSRGLPWGNRRDCGTETPLLDGGWGVAGETHRGGCLTDGLRFTLVFSLITSIAWSRHEFNTPVFLRWSQAAFQECR